MADPIQAQIQAGAVTPGRSSTATFDVTEDVLTEPAFTLHREAGQVQPSAKSSVIKVHSGAFILKPINDLDVSTERTDVAAAILRLSNVNASPVVQEINRHRSLTELSGVSPSGNVAATGDYYFTKRVAAGATWNNILAGGTTPSVLGTTNYPLDRLLTGPQTPGYYDSDVGFLLRILVSGSFLGGGDVIAGFEFGGSLIGEASAAHKDFGRFWLALTGDGKALLYEYVDAAWTLVATWRWASPKDTAQTAIHLRILPLAPSFIEFTTLAAPAAETVLGILADSAYLAIKNAHKDTSLTSTYLHRISNRGKLALAGNQLRPITGPGPIGFDLRRDLRCEWQISPLKYPASGSLTDRGFSLAYGVSTAHIVRPVSIGYDYFSGGVTQQTSHTATLETSTGGALTPANETYTWRGTNYTVSGYAPPGGLNKLRAVITLTNSEPSGSRYHTPVVVAYEVHRLGHIASHAPTPKTGGNLLSVSLTGPGYEPDQETASLVIEDLENELSFLRARGKASVRLETTFDPADQTKKAIIHEGYTGRVTAVRKGKTGMVYPSAEWRTLQIDCVGKWDRLAERFFYQRQFFNRDLTAATNPSGDFQPWKVTDIIRQTLLSQGFGETQLDIFDDPIRIFISPHGGENNFSVPPGTPIDAFLKDLARDYLNAYFTWEAGARPTGATTQGMWRLRRPPTGSETPLWNFVTTAASGLKLQHRPAAHGATHSAILGNPYEFRSYVVPPEGNVLTVTGSEIDLPNGGTGFVQRQLVNPASWDSPTHTVASASDIDYLGTIKPIEYVDPTITDQNTCDFLARRIYNLACRGRKWFEFVSVYPLVVDSTLLADGGAAYTNTTYPRRPLMPGDVITIDGETCILHSINGIWRKDVVQLAYIEAELFRADTTFT